MVCNNDDDYKVDCKTAEVARNQKYDTLFKNILIHQVVIKKHQCQNYRKL